MAYGSCPAEPEQKCYPEAQKQGTETNQLGTANDDERKSEYQRSVRNDEIVQAPFRTQYVICPAGMGNRSLRNWVMNQCDPKWKKHDCDRGAHHQCDRDGANYKRQYRGSLSFLTVQDHQREDRYCEKKRPEEQGGMVSSSRSGEKYARFEKRSPLTISNPVIKIRQSIQIDRCCKSCAQLPRGIYQKTF